MALMLPGLAKTNMGEANRSPCEQSCKTRKSEKPVENFYSGGSLLNISQGSGREVNEDRRKRPTRLIDVSENLRSIALSMWESASSPHFARLTISNMA